MPWITALVGPDIGTPTYLQFCNRTVILFVFGIFCIRVGGRRTFSSLSPLDIVVAVIVGSSLSRTMTGNAPFVPTMFVTLLLMVLHRLVAMASLHWGGLARLVKGQPAELIRDGVTDEAAMQRCQITTDDLLEGLRLMRVDKVEKVARATLERGGKISVVRKE